MFAFLISFTISVVHDIDPNILKTIIGRQKYIFVNFYCPSCLHSQESLPLWDNFSSIYETNHRFEFYRIDCDRYHTKCVEFEASGYPTLSLFLPGSKSFVRYNRNHDTKQFIIWVRQNTGISPETNLEL